MKKLARTILLFVLCFAPAAAMFALTLEWARPAAPVTPTTVPLAESSPADNRPQPSLFPMTPDGRPDRTLYEPPVIATAQVGQSSVMVIDRDSEPHSLYSRGESVDETLLTDFLTHGVAAADPPDASFQDRLTRSGWATIGLALITLTGVGGLLLFQRRMQERTL